MKTIIVNSPSRAAKIETTLNQQPTTFVTKRGAVLFIFKLK
jgi:hypothetical protein